MSELIDNISYIFYCRELVTPDTIHYLTRRTVREGLERKFNLRKDTLLCKKEQINSILERIIERMRGKMFMEGVFIIDYI